ncbi:hypothetical protein [Cytobacillus massiliigabonensis]
MQGTNTLINGVKKPWVGLGVFDVEVGQVVVEAVKPVIRNGYCSIKEN